MNIKKENRNKEFIIGKLLGLVYRMENIGHGHLTSSGENQFIADTCKQFKGPMTFFDIGANIGEYTQTIQNNRPNSTNDSFHLFEPQKNCFQELVNKFGKYDHISVNNVGLSDIRGEATIYKDREKSGLTSLYNRNLDFYGHKMDLQEEVLLERADSYIEKHNISKINLIKIDVEGNEMNVLLGFGRFLDSNFIDLIQFEYGGANIDSHTNLMDFYKLLEPHGFKLCKIMKNHLEIRDYNPRLENFVCQNYVAVSKSFMGITKNS